MTFCILIKSQHCIEHDWGKYSIQILKFLAWYGRTCLIPSYTTGAVAIISSTHTRTHTIYIHILCVCVYQFVFRVLNSSPDDTDRHTHARIPRVFVTSKRNEQYTGNNTVIKLSIQSCYDIFLFVNDGRNHKNRFISGYWAYFTLYISILYKLYYLRRQDTLWGQTKLIH